MYLAHNIDQIHNLLNKSKKKKKTLVTKTGGILKLII